MITFRQWALSEMKSGKDKWGVRLALAGHILLGHPVMHEVSIDTDSYGILIDRPYARFVNCTIYGTNIDTTESPVLIDDDTEFDVDWDTEDWDGEGERPW